MVYGWQMKNALYLSVNVISMKEPIGDTIFYVSNWRWGHHFTWSSESRKGPAIYSAKAVPLFLSYFKTLSSGPAPARNLPHRSQHTLPTELTLPCLKHSF